MVIQVMDLGLILPLVVLAGVLLIKRQPWGYLLGSVAVMKMMTMGFAVRRGSIRGLLIWLGGLWYFFYNYMFYLFGAAFNEFLWFILHCLRWRQSHLSFFSRGSM
jgi:hypothetical protein